MLNRKVFVFKSETFILCVTWSNRLLFVRIPRRNQMQEIKFVVGV